jgi:hypothetical protein
MVPDYNALYTNYYVPLQCNPELVPVGVVGFYVWSVLFIVTISSFGKQFDEVDFSFRRLLNGITGIATYSLHIYSLLKRNYECYGEALNVLGYLKDPISEYYITKLVNYGLGALVGICAVIDSVWKPFRYVTLWTVALVIFANYWSSLMYDTGYTNFAYIDSSILGPIMAVSILPIIFVVTAAGLLFLGMEMLIWIGVIIVMAFQLWAVGMAAVLFVGY